MTTPDTKTELEDIKAYLLCSDIKIWFLAGLPTDYKTTIKQVLSQNCMSYNLNEGTQQG